MRQAGETLIYQLGLTMKKIEAHQLHHENVYLVVLGLKNSFASPNG